VGGVVLEKQSEKKPKAWIGRPEVEVMASLSAESAFELRTLGVLGSPPAASLLGS
jgi:hypothetical protein